MILVTPKYLGDYSHSTMHAIHPHKGSNISHLKEEGWIFSRPHRIAKIIWIFNIFNFILFDFSMRVDISEKKLRNIGN